jgi:hypothetical protein
VIQKRPTLKIGFPFFRSRVAIDLYTGKSGAALIFFLLSDCSAIQKTIEALLVPIES